MPPSEPVICKGNTKSSLRITQFRENSSTGSGAVAFVDRVLTTPRMGSTAYVSVGHFPTEWWPTAFRIGPKSHRKRWLHPLRKARIANLMSKAHGS